MPRAAGKTGRIGVGIGGWTYEPWRGTFYPPGTPLSRELDYASRRMTSIEINGTFYRLQKPSVFARWRDATPEDFVFCLKAPRFIVQRKDLTTAGAAVERFISSGIAKLDAKLGPILWQLAPSKLFKSDELDAFLALLPSSVDGLQLRHALDVRHASFMTPEFIGILRRHKVAVVFEDDADHRGCADLTSSFVYARLRRSAASIKTGYPVNALKLWARRIEAWAKGKEPKDLPRISPPPKSAALPRDVFIYFINGAKERAPAAAQKLLSILRNPAS